jgi:tripartite-type tricarboxylate transporter receptor subunit TctC
MNPAGAALVCIVAASSVAAAAYPERPLRLIVPLAANGGMDSVARGIAIRLTEGLGQTIVAHAAPDGYTLMMVSASSVIHPLMYKARYDVVQDFAPVSQVTSQPHIIVIHPALPVKSVNELIAYGKANPDKLNYASAGNGSLIHLTSELFKSMTGMPMAHIPYKGIGAAYPDIIGGQVQLTFASLISGLPQMRAQRLRALAVTGTQRSKLAPEVPTVAESGVAGFVVYQWYALLAPARTPAEIVDRLNVELARALTLPDVIARLAADGAEATASSPQQLATHIRAERDKWARVIKVAGIKGD